MAKNSYVIWKHMRVKNNATLSSFKGFESEWKLTDGVSVQKEFPDDAKFFMHPDRPNDTVLTDDLRNLHGVIVASERLAAFLQSQDVPNIEYLPVTIMNHKKKPTKEKFFIVNPVDPIDCIDMKQSKIEMSTISPEDIDEVDQLVIDEKKIPKERSMVRIRGLSGVVLVSRDLASKIDKEKFTGIGWQEVSSYTTSPI